MGGNGRPSDPARPTARSRRLLRRSASTPRVGASIRSSSVLAGSEAACYADVDARMRRLPARDQRRLTWLSKDVFSQSFVTALPTPECALPNAEFAEATTAYTYIT